MRFQSLLAFPVSLALLWSAAGPFTNAAPAPLPPDAGKYGELLYTPTY